MMKKIFGIFLLLLITCHSFCQEDICIGEKYRIYSQHLGEEREYQVYLPDSYHEEENAGKKYPVIYLIDGESLFLSLTAIYQSFFTERASLIPESILVGIVSTDRTRDLTPTKSAYRRDGTLHEGDKETGGGSSIFTDFVLDELRNSVDASYRTNGKNTLIGHSYGGLFVINTFLYNTDKFDTYIAIDPSLWWDNAQLAKEAETILKTKQLANKVLYVGVATAKRPNNRYIHFDIMRHFIDEILPEAENNGLHYYSKSFPDENHGSIPIPAIRDVFRQIYANKYRGNKVK